MISVEILVGLLALLVLLVLVAERLAVPFPVVLVISGLALGFVPGLPPVALPPDLVLLIFLPPLLFAQALTLSWRDFIANLRPILLLSIGLVLATMGLVGTVAHAVIPHLPWAAAFALGAIMAPTDAVAVTAIVQKLPLPRRLVTILSYESMVNDSASLVCYKLAVLAAATGVFSAGQAAWQFTWSSLGGVGVGLAVGWAIVGLRRRMEPNPTVENTISLLSPFAAYLPAEALNVSGVLAVVALGLYAGRQGPRFVSASTRLQAGAMWAMIDFLLNGLLFILVGLQLHTIVGHIAGRHFFGLVLHAALLSLVVIAIRIIWVFGTAYLPPLVQRKRPPLPPWPQIVIVAWTGTRGGLSLAAALALPLAAFGKPAFPQRDLLIFLTFTVILSTLVIQGLSLPWLIRHMDLRDDGEEAREEAQAHQQGTQAALDRLTALAEEENLPTEMVEDMRGHYDVRNARFAARADGRGGAERESEAMTPHHMRREMVAAERQTVVGLRDDGTISDGVLQRVQKALDLEEQRLELEEAGELEEDAEE